MQSRKEVCHGTADDCVTVGTRDAASVHRLHPGVAEQCFPRSCQITTIDDLLLSPPGKSPRVQWRAALPLVQGGQGRSAESLSAATWAIVGLWMLTVAWCALEILWNASE